MTHDIDRNRTSEANDGRARAAAEPVKTVTLVRFSRAARAIAERAQTLADARHQEVTLLHLMASALGFEATRQSAMEVGADVAGALARLAPALDALPRGDGDAVLGAETLQLLAELEKGITYREILFQDVLSALVRLGDGRPPSAELAALREAIEIGRLARLDRQTPEAPFTLPPTGDLTEAEQSALNALRRALDDKTSILRAWQEKDLFVGRDDAGIRILLGPASSPDVARAAQRYEVTTGQRFPPLLRAVLHMFDGVEVQAIPESRLVVERVPEVTVTRGLLPACLIGPSNTADDEHGGLLFARAYSQCDLLVLDDDADAGRIMFDDFENPQVVAENLADFLRQLVAYGLSIEALVGANT